jgi:NhaA family Na+:H+ antiporter
MTTHAIHLRYAHARGRGNAATRLMVGLHFVTGRYLLLPIGAAAALVWANAWPESYFRFAHALAFPVNEIAMVFFFGLVAQEIFEELMPGGALHNWRRWTLPIVGAAGGLAGAAAVYGAFVSWKIEPLFHDAWPIVAGVDIAFAYIVVKSIFHRHPAVSFLLLLAVASNAFGVLAIAPTFVNADSRAGGAVLLMAAGLSVAAWLRRQHVREFWPYIWIAGGLSWLALYLEGFHPGLALVPIIPFMPHVRRRLEEVFADDAEVRGVTPRHFEHVWHYHVQVALLLFGLVNAGVVLHGYGNGTWATLLASVAGRTLGIAAALALAVMLGLRLPAQLRWRDITVVALAAGAGVTFTLFFATTLYPAGPFLAELKLGALLTGVGVPLAFVAARALHVGRFRDAMRPDSYAPDRHRRALP